MSVVVEEELDQRRWDGHLLLLHRDESERQAAVVDWVRRGLELDEKIYCCEPAALAPERRLTRVLPAVCPQAEQALAAGQLQVLPPVEFYPSCGQLPLIQRGIAEGFRGVRMASEVADALTVLSVDSHNAIEWGFDEISRSYPVSALCQHRVDTLADPGLDRVVATHLGGLREHLLQSGRDGADALTLTGEIDLSNVGLLASALRVITAADHPVVRLDLRGLTHIDAGGVGVLAHVSEAYRRRGGRLALLASGRCERVLRLLEVPDLPNVTLVGREGSPDATTLGCEA